MTPSYLLRIIQSQYPLRTGFGQKCGMDSFEERLKTARLRAGFKTARIAAKSLGVPYPTYAAHENGNREPPISALAQYARRFAVSIDWLIQGRDTKFDEQTVATAVATLFDAIPATELARREPAAVAEIVVKLCRALRRHPDQADTIGNVVRLFSEAG